MNRKPFVWNVQLVDDKGQTHLRPYSTHWDPEKVSVEEIAGACAIEAKFFEGMVVVGAVAVAA